MQHVTTTIRQGLAVMLATLSAGAALAEVAPVVSANSGFQAGPHRQATQRLEVIDLDSLRDGVVWGRIEQQPGVYVFDRPNQRGIMELIESGRAGSITVYPRNPIYESGDTLLTDEGIAAFARFVAALKVNYPQIDTIQVGNEFNSTSFQHGPAKKMTPLERARLHARHLAAIAAQPELEGVRILGGSTHSIAAGYIWEVLDAGGAAHMQAVALHPYTTPPEQIPGEIAVLRRHPDMAGLEIEATEFGTQNIEHAPDIFWRNYCALSMAGVQRAVWYPLEPRGDNYVPVLAENYALTPVGQALMLAHETAGGQEVEPFRPDPYTYGCRFGDGLAVLWGVERDLEILRGGIELLSGGLEPITEAPTLAPDRVLVLRDPDGALDLHEDLLLGPLGLRADSFHEFDRPAEGATAVDGDTVGFDRMLMRGDEVLDLSTCPGQQAPSTPWRPYLCQPEIPNFKLTPESFTLGGQVSLVHAYNPAESGSVIVEVEIAMESHSRNGVGVALEAGDRPADRRVVQGEQTLEFGPVEMRPGTPLRLVIDPNGGPAGDSGTLRITVRDAGQALGPMLR